MDRPRRTEGGRATRPLGPVTFDARELDLVEWIHHYVLVRDACLAPAHLVHEKLQRLGAADGRLVAHLSSVRHQIRDTGILLPCERRRLVLLDVLAALPASAEDDVPWSRDPVDLVGEAAAPIGYGPADVRRLARTLAMARAALPPVDVPPSTPQALAQTLRGVIGVTPGAATAQAVLLLEDRLPSPWTASACGMVLLDPAPVGHGALFGTLVARADLAAFVEDLATLRVAADLSATAGRYAQVLLPELAADLRAVGRPGRPGDVPHLAASLVDRTAALLPRGFRCYDRTTHRRRTPRILLDG
ncbi:hypothetical protein [Mobilicoccus pelagius]|nr:hypothetical protein [Mobilicoccus pelagius]